MDYLKEKGRQNLLPELTQSLEEKLAKEKQVDEIVVSSVVKLSSVQLNTLKSIVYKSLSVKYPVINKVDENLIGGITVKVNDLFVDLSISYEMDNLKRNLLI